jgi:hypothetical protein
MSFVGGVELMYDSVSKSEDVLLDMTGINRRKCLNENLCLYMLLRNIVATVSHGTSEYTFQCFISHEIIRLLLNPN